MKDTDGYCKMCGNAQIVNELTQVGKYSVCCKCFKKVYMNAKRKRHGRKDI